MSGDLANCEKSDAISSSLPISELMDDRSDFVVSLAAEDIKLCKDILIGLRIFLIP